MNRSELNRRDFNKLTAAAFGGMVSGTLAGCGGGGDGAGGGKAAATELHLCRGLNTCKGKGADGQNECAGAGTCATVEHHACGGKNTCKGLGGCGNDAGMNECKGQGGCEVPLMDDPWKQVREQLRVKMEAEGKQLLEAPPTAGA